MRITAMAKRPARPVTRGGGPLDDLIKWIKEALTRQRCIANAITLAALLSGAAILITQTPAAIAAARTMQAPGW